MCCDAQLASGGNLTETIWKIVQGEHTERICPWEGCLVQMSGEFAWGNVWECSGSLSGELSRGNLPVGGMSGANVRGNSPGKCLGMLREFVWETFQREFVRAMFRGRKSLEGKCLRKNRPDPHAGL